MNITAKIRIVRRICMDLNTTIQEKFLFLYKFLSSPKQIGSVTPSSSYLCKKMVQSVPWDHVQNVAELGCGTGALTRYIQQARKPGTKVLLFEKEAHLQTQIAARYPEFPCYGEASQLDAVLQKEGIESLDCILSGLPFFNFPQELRDVLMNQIHDNLKKDGLFIAFQYSKQMKKQLSDLFDIQEIHFVPMNIPPAFVYVCRKR